MPEAPRPHSSFHPRRGCRRQRRKGALARSARQSYHARQGAASTPGAVPLGRAFGHRGGGGEGMEAGIATIAGGAIIIAAAVYFGQLDTSWIPA